MNKNEKNDIIIIGGRSGVFYKDILRIPGFGCGFCMQKEPSFEVLDGDCIYNGDYTKVIDVRLEIKCMNCDKSYVKYFSHDVKVYINVIKKYGPIYNEWK